MRQTTKDYRNIATLAMYAERAAKQGFLSEITCVFAYKKTLKLNNNGSYFKVYSDGSPSRVCKEQSDGIAIVRTFQPLLYIAKPQVRNRVTYDPPVNSRMLCR